MDKKIFYRNLKFFSEHKKALKLLKFIYKVLPNIVFLVYPFLLAVTFFTVGFGSLWLRLVLVPFGVLVLVTLLRMAINEPRPYERFGEPSLFDKQTKGRSMPSRHTASTFVIAMAFLRVNLPLGLFMMLLSVLIMLSRVLAGAHYVRDVLVGAMLAISLGQIMFISL